MNGFSPLTLLREAARRQNLPDDLLPPDETDPRYAAFLLPLLGDAPRIGAVLDVLRAGTVSGVALPRHLSSQEGPHIALGPYRFIPADGLLERDGAPALRLTEKERDILLMLHDAGGVPVSRRLLLDRVWGYAGGVETHTLETHIYRLRQKIETDPARPQILLTAGEGYALGAGA